MSIKNISQMQQTLKGYDSTGWSKKVDLESGHYAPAPASPGESGKISNKSFGEFLTDSLAEVNKLQQDANVAMEKLATGESKNLHETMIAVEKADIAFRTMNQVRQKVIDAYKEVMKMQI